MTIDELKEKYKDDPDALEMIHNSERDIADSKRGLINRTEEQILWELKAILHDFY
ncbi:MAG: hypothetical protein ACI4MT_06135 [Christensenellales bacterium]